MKFLSVDTIETAREKLLGCVRHWRVPIEYVPLGSATGRTLAEDIYARDSIPAFRRAAVDGFAVVSADTTGAGETIPVILNCKGSIAVGEKPSFSITNGECAAIPTGAALPDGADAVVMIEYTEQFDEKTVAVYEAAACGSGAVQIGEDVMKDALLLSRGILLRPCDIGALAADGTVHIPVFSPLALTILSTGDELVKPSDPCSAAQVRDINSDALAALARQSGYAVTRSAVIRDDITLLENAIRAALRESDIIAVSGGSSQGNKDETRGAFERITKTEVLVHGIAAKPGKPTIISFDGETETLLIGLPGHPAAALTMFKQVVTWLNRTLTGQPEQFPIPARLSCNVAGSPGRTTYQPVALRLEGGAYTAEPVFGKSSMITAMTKADGYIVLAMNTEGLTKDTNVLVYRD